MSSTLFDFSTRASDRSVRSSTRAQWMPNPIPLPSRENIMESFQKPPTNQSGQEAKGLIIYNVRLAHRNREQAEKLWRVKCWKGQVLQISENHSTPKEDPHDPMVHIDADGSIMLPSLCHSHIHLDKCFILDRCHIRTGDFSEAMDVTAAAKAGFPFDEGDLFQRGCKLVRESVQCGVTSMRAHVEVDRFVRFSCLEAAFRIKDEFKDICDIQIAVFAQERLFGLAESKDPGENYDLLLQAVERSQVEVVGSAPYVEFTPEQQRKNITLLLEAAGRSGKHVDFHLDYNLDRKSEPLIHYVVSEAKRLIRYWRPTSGVPLRGITIGHATRLQLFTPNEWAKLVESIGDLPIGFIGLPNSDMYIQGREDINRPLGPPRSTLRVPYIRKYGLHVAMSVNNVENAFTPQGSLDPLALCTLGVAIFQTATAEDLRTLVRSVTLTSKRVIGQDNIPRASLVPAKGDPADFVIVHGTTSLQQVALNPSYDRTTIRRGVIVSQRRTQKWFIDDQPPRVTATLAWYKRVKWRALLCPPLFCWKLIRGTLLIPQAKAEESGWPEGPNKGSQGDYRGDKLYTVGKR